MPRVQAGMRAVKEQSKVPLHLVWNGIPCRPECCNKRPEQGRLEMEPFPAVGRIVEKQKDGTVVFTENRWKGKVNPARCGTDEPVGSIPAHSGGVKQRQPKVSLLLENHDSAAI